MIGLIVLGWLFHSLMFWHAYWYFIAPSSYDNFIIIYSLYTIFYIISLCSLPYCPYGGKRRIWDRLRWVHQQWVQLRQQRRELRIQARVQGIAGWRWHGLSYLGVMMSVVSLYPASEWRSSWWSAWISTLGFLGWIAIFGWKIRCEERWGHGEGTVDRSFVHRRLLQVVLSYSLPLLAFPLWRLVMGTRYQGWFVIGVLFFYSFSVFPMWGHLLLGQRTAPPHFSPWKPWHPYGHLVVERDGEVGFGDYVRSSGGVPLPLVVFFIIFGAFVLLFFLARFLIYIRFGIGRE